MDNNEDSVECPLCMEPLEVDDLKFFPCTCGYQICRFCWHRIRTDENKLCPACRKEYTENPADFTPLTQEQILAFKSQKKQRDQKRKQKVRVTENRKHLSNVRVVQKNLVFVVGLPPRLADAEVLKKHEYFGKYGKIHKVVINPSTAYAGVQGPSASAYVTYVNNNDALRAIQSVNTRNIIIDGRLIKTSLGTTKYCSHFMKNQGCPKGDCMYLHELGDPEASFTKEEMHQGKHQEYEKRLHDALVVSSNSAGTSGSNETNQANGSGGAAVWGSSGEEKNHGSTSKTSNTNKTNSSTQAQAMNSSTLSSSPSILGASSGSSVETTATDSCPTLSISPVSKESSGEVKNKKERGRHEKIKNDKSTKSKNKNSSNDASKSYGGNAQRENSSNNSDVKDGSDTSADGTASKFASPVQVRNLTPNSSGTIITKGKLNKPKASKKGVDENDIKQMDESENNFGENENEIESDNVVSNNSNSVLSSELFESPEETINESTDSKENEISEIDDLLADKSFEDPILKNEENEFNPKSGIPQLNLFDNKLSPLFSPETSQQNSVSSDDKVEDLSNQLNNVKISPLPDLLKGIEEQQFQHVHPHQQKELARFLELHKQNSLFGNLNLLQSNVPPSGLHNHFAGLPEVGPSPLTTLEHASELLMSQNLYGINMSKFFDFHKNQQLQLQQHIVGNEQTVGNGSNTILENTPNPYPFMQHSTLSNLQQQQQQQQQQHHQLQQQQQQKQRNQLDSMLGMQLHNATMQPPPQQQPQPHQQHPLLQNQHGRMQNEFSANAFVDDDLGFDPFTETQKGLAELMENEILKPQHSKPITNNAMRMAAEPNIMHQHQHPIDHMQRARMPPPGFNHMNTFGLNPPREPNTSKIMPFLSMSGNRGHANDIQHLPAFNTWDTHLQSPRHHLPNFNDIQAHQMNQNNRNAGNLGNDWTAMDPAILSFRQFPSCPQPSQMLHHHQQKDLFPPHLTQQQQQQNTFGNQAHGGANILLPNNQVNSQSVAQAQVNANVQGMLEYLKNNQLF